MRIEIKASKREDEPQVIISMLYSEYMELRDFVIINYEFSKDSDMLKKTYPGMKDIVRELLSNYQ